MTIPGVHPALLMGLLLAAIATQVAYMVRPGHPAYWSRFAVATSSVLLAEIVARLFFADRLSFGDLHPLVDLLFLGLGQWTLISLAPGSRPRRAGAPSFKAELRRGM